MNRAPGVELRSVGVDDAAALTDLVGRNVDHLRPWMAWADREPLDAADRRALLADWAAQRRRGGDRHHLVIVDDSAVGMVGVLRRDGRAVEVGYWLDAGHQGRGLMTAAVGAAVDIAFEDRGTAEVLIRHDTTNVASRGIPRRLGFRFVEEAARAPAAPAETASEWRWSMPRRRWARGGDDDITIRTFVDADRPAVIGLWHETGLFRPWNDPDRDIDRKLAHSPEGLLIADSHGTTVGTAMVGYDGHRGWINYLAVSPAHRGRGIAARLVSEAEIWLACQGCPKINLQVRPDNEEATSMYRHLGYEPFDTHDLGRRLIVDSERDADGGAGDC